MMLYRDKDTGEIYRHLAVGVDCAEAREGALTTIFAPMDDEHTIYLMDQREHEERFEIVSAETGKDEEETE